MRFAELIIYNEGNPRKEGFSPTAIRRLRPKEQACQVVISDLVEPMESYWTDLDMSYAEALLELNRALAESVPTAEDETLFEEMMSQTGGPGHPAPIDLPDPEAPDGARGPVKGA